MKTCVSSTPHMGLGPELGLSKHLLAREQMPSGTH